MPSKSAVLDPDQTLPLTDPFVTSNPASHIHESALPTKAVVVHGGARDAYQLALALSEAGLLEKLVTDLFWPSDRPWAKVLAGALPRRWLSQLQRRSARNLPSRQVTTLPSAGLGGLLLDKLHGLPFVAKRKASRSADAMLGRAAGLTARRTSAGLVSYSYFGYDAFKAYGRGGMLFQMHPHPATMRRILQQELKDHPDCASSLTREWELALPEEDFQHLVSECSMASHFLVASSFTRKSLVEHGTREDRISVVPYGVDLHKFTPDGSKAQSRTKRLRVLFVGRINQRKGLKYLLEAMRLLDNRDVELTICGRVVDGLDLIRPYLSQINLRPSVGPAELVHAYQSADLFVLPSIGEGFGQVLLEALACGLPILATTHTAAPDLIHDGVEGFIIPPRRPDLLADRINWALMHRRNLAAMDIAARACAERFTWERFRTRSAEAVAAYLREARQTDHTSEVA